ncbi:MAG: hypothetical protein DRI46_11215 [Chloroflexi bacterium]|nr:MAG: hypothetical protein DRI46_11215 [Chloroflexota bacterium]
MNMSGSEMNNQEFILEYANVLEVTARDILAWEEKAEALVILSDKIEEIRTEVDRSVLLDMRLQLDSLKKASARTDKLVKSCINWADSAILLRLQDEQLDNYSYLGKIYYPSTTVYPSVADRNALEAHMVESGRLDILGNTLNREVVNDYLEQTGELPPGVNSISRTRLNCRAKP